MATVINAVKVNVSRLGTEPKYLVYQQNIRLFYERLFDLIFVSPFYLVLAVTLLWYVSTGALDLGVSVVLAVAAFIGGLFFVVCPLEDLRECRAAILKFESVDVKVKYEDKYSESWNRSEQRDHLYHTHSECVCVKRYRWLMSIAFRLFF